MKKTYWGAILFPINHPLITIFGKLNLSKFVWPVKVGLGFDQFVVIAKFNPYGYQGAATLFNARQLYQGKSK